MPSSVPARFASPSGSAQPTTSDPGEEDLLAGIDAPDVTQGSEEVALGVAFEHDVLSPPDFTSALLKEPYTDEESSDLETGPRQPTPPTTPTPAVAKPPPW